MAQDWCPTPSQLAVLGPHFLFTRASGCCLFKLEAVDPSRPAAKAALEAAGVKTSLQPDLNACTGDDGAFGPSPQTQQPEVTFTVVPQAELDAKIAERKRFQVAEERRSIAKLLRDLPLSTLCSTIGTVIRGEGWFYEAPLMKGDALPFARSEIRRRGQSITDARVRAETIKIGDSECHMYAAWGVPSDANRHVSSSGVRTQHVYGGGTYVYTNNGVITSWQD